MMDMLSMNRPMHLVNGIVIVYVIFTSDLSTLFVFENITLITKCWIKTQFFNLKPATPQVDEKTLFF